MRRRLRSPIVLIAALVVPLALLATSAFAIFAPPNIDPLNKFAWGENIGWLNSNPSSGGGVRVTSLALTGYVWAENKGWISLNCLNTGSCGTVSYGVTNDGAGHLKGMGWGENIGWVNFSCQTNALCAGSAGNWGVTINPATGDFRGQAWGENVGWIRFNCADDASCGTVSYKTNTTCALATDPDCNADVDFSNPGAGLPCVQDHIGDANNDGYSDSDAFTPPGAPTCTGAYPAGGGLGLDPAAPCPGRNLFGTPAQVTAAKIARADVDLNGVINILDLSAIASVYHQSGFGANPADYRNEFDQDGNGVINILDLSAVAGQYHKFVPPC